MSWRLIGVFHCCLGGSVELCKGILRACIDEYEQVVASGLASSLHRVAKRLLDPQSACGRELREWLADTTGKLLQDFGIAFMMLQAYALVTLVERRIESIHATLKRLLRKTTFIQPATLCALAREVYNMSLLKDQTFYKLAVDMWRKRGLFDTVLKHLYTPDQLKAKSGRVKLKLIYHCSLEQEYGSTAAIRVEESNFQQMVAVGRPRAVVQPPDVTHLVTYLKELLRRADFF